MKAMKARGMTVHLALGLAAILALACGARREDNSNDAAVAETGPEGPPACTDPPKDSDGDSISDADEGAAIGIDTDGDGTPDYRDDDSDGDGVRDRVEAGDDNLCTPPRDADGDGVPDFRDKDADGNGIPDGTEGTADADRDGVPDAFDLDDDDDMIVDVFEVRAAAAGQEAADLDTDGDGVPDRLDLDADGDGVPDLLEGGFDRDGDGLMNQRDLDADGDCIPDAVEAGSDPTRPVNSDEDGYPDFLDFDSDNDGLPDKLEDINCDGAVQLGESDPRKADTDGDGFPDVVEKAAGSDPADPNSKLNPGDFYFILPYQGPLVEAALDFQTEIVKADLVFNVDTTGSMTSVEHKLQETLISRIVPGTAKVIPNLNQCVSSFQDFPIAPFGESDCGGRPDLPFRLLQRCSNSVQKTADAIDQYDKPQGCGADNPESGYEALYQVATGEGVSWPGGSVSKFDATRNYDAAADMGPIGGVGLRVGALPIVVHVTDVGSHDQNDYKPHSVFSHSKEETIAALKAVGARVVGVAVTEGAGGGAVPHLEELARQTGAMVAPLDAFPSGGGSCLTGPSGKAKAPDADGLCPLVFEINYDGSGLADAVVDAIGAIAFYAAIDITALATGDLAKLPAIDTGAFVKSTQPIPPAPPGARIMNDAFLRVRPGSPVRFLVRAQNDFVRPTREPQLFEVTLQVVGDLVTILDQRRIFVVVPPADGPS